MDPGSINPSQHHRHGLAPLGLLHCHANMKVPQLWPDLYQKKDQSNTRSMEQWCVCVCGGGTEGVGQKQTQEHHSAAFGFPSG